MRSRYCSSFGGRPCPASRGSSSICAQCTSPRAHLVHNLCRLCGLCVRRHTFTTHSATVIRMGQSTVEICSTAVLASVCRCSSTFPTILLPPVCHQSLGVLNILSAPSVSSPTPLDTPELPHCSLHSARRRPLSMYNDEPHTAWRKPRFCPLYWVR